VYVTDRSWEERGIPLERRPPVVEHRRTPDHHTTIGGCAMAVLHSNRARLGSGTLASHLEASNYTVRVNTDPRWIHGVRGSNLAGSPTSRAGLRPGQHSATRARRVVWVLNSVQAPCPCDRCPQAALCGDLHLACRAFSQFVRGVQWTSTARRPTHKRYVQLFASKASGEPPC
jgi:hypothetical protein